MAPITRGMPNGFGPCRPGQTAQTDINRYFWQCIKPVFDTARPEWFILSGLASNLELNSHPNSLRTVVEYDRSSWKMTEITLASVSVLLFTHFNNATL